MNLHQCEEDACLCRTCAQHCVDCGFCGAVSRTPSPVVKCDKHTVEISILGGESDANAVD